MASLNALKNKGCGLNGSPEAPGSLCETFSAFRFYNVVKLYKAFFLGLPNGSLERL